MRPVPATAALLVCLALTPAAAVQYGASPPPAPAVPQRTEGPAAPAAPSPPGDVLRAAVCSVGRSADAGAALLATTPFSAEERTQAGNFIRNAQRCLRRREPILTPAYVARGAAAEATYEAQFASPVAARTPALGAAPLVRPASGLPAETMRVLATMYQLADCATPRQPDLVRALLATEPRGPEEGAAFAALHPAFGTCVPAGTQLTYDPRVMRVLFAEALFRWSVVQRDGAAAPHAPR